MHGDKIKLFYLNLILCNMLKLELKVQYFKTFFIIKFHYLKKQVLHKYTKTCTTIYYFVLICHFLHPCGLNTKLSFSILFTELFQQYITNLFLTNFEILALLTTVRKDYGRRSMIQLVPDIDSLQQVEDYVRQYQVQKGFFLHQIA